MRTVEEELMRIMTEIDAPVRGNAPRLNGCLAAGRRKTAEERRQHAFAAGRRKDRQVPVTLPTFRGNA